MIDETLNPPVADTEAERKAALKAEGEKLGIKFHPRHSAQRMADMIAEKKGEAVAKPEPAAPAPEPAPAPQPYNAPKGMTTTMDLTQPGDLARDEDERRLLMEQCARLGITNVIPPRANNDTIRDKINAHMAAKAQMQAIIDEQQRRASRAPVEEKVQVRVLKLGDNKISKGIHIPGMGDAHYARGDIIPDVPLTRARELEDTGMAEIVGA